jgi:trehalose 6-phosphate phosphatase
MIAAPATTHHLAVMPAPPLPGPDWALFLDIDGTLIDLAPSPDAVIVPASLRDNLALLHHGIRALALISGRSLSQIDTLFSPLILPASGQHGAELRLERQLIESLPLPAIRAVVPALHQFAADHHGILVEDKGDSVAVHYRAAPTLAEEVEAITRRLVGDSLEVEVLPARMAFDIKPRRVSKGRAIAWFMEHPPFAGRLPVFVGDDHTDETGFAAVNELGGHSIRVGHEKESEARFSLGSAAAVREWVAGLVRYYRRAEGPDVR